MRQNRENHCERSAQLQHVIEAASSCQPVRPNHFQAVSNGAKPPSNQTAARSTPQRNTGGLQPLWPARSRSPLGGKFWILIAIVFSVCLISRGFAQTPPAGVNPRFFMPVMQWGRQILYDCSKYDENLECEPGFAGIEPERVQEAGHWKACTSDPAKEYECSLTSPIGCECNGLCIPVGDFNGTCYDMLLGMEDNWVRLAARVLHNPGLDQAIPFDDPLWLDDYIRVSMNVTYGSLDVYATSVICDKFCPREFCVVCDENCGDGCIVGKGNVTVIPAEDMPLRLTYSWDRVVMNITDNWPRLDQHLLAAKYRPDANVNTYKLRRERLSTQPWELLYMQVLYNNPSYGPNIQRVRQGPWLDVGTFVQLVHIVDLNDPPRITPPTVFTPKCNISELEPGAERPYECYFGPFWSIEDTATRIEVPGVSVDDDDLDERCPFGEECARMDIEVRAFKGALGLNTRSDLIFYDIGDPDNRAGSGFTAVVSAAQNAIKVLFYQVELGQFLGPGSKVLDYNTQHGGQIEYLTVTASDQGSNSVKGLAAFSVIQVPIQIVADNDPPTITLQQLEFEATEDVEELLEGITIQDVDVDEQVESQLALEDWMSVASEAVFMNQLQVQVAVQYGALKLGYLRNLQLVATTTMAWMTIEPFRFGHDACLVDGLREDTKALEAALGDTVPVLPFSDICAYENVGAPTCPTGTESGCRCTVEGTCRSDKVVLYLNATKDFASFKTALTAAMNQVNQTCGGMPVYAVPNNWTQGVPCASNEDCRYLPQCEPAVPGEEPTEATCRCCSDINVPCSDNTVCSEIDQGSLCGCMPGGSGWCGPFRTESGVETFDLIRVGETDVPQLFGEPCRYLGPGLTTCQAPTYAYEGTNLAKIVDLVALTSRGSSTFTFYGPMVDVNRAISQLVYLSGQDYNRFFRPPVEEREFGFNVEADSVDTLDIVAGDMGNSGGLRRDPKTTQVRATVRVKAVNDPPQASGPSEVKAFEDLPLTFRDGERHPLRAERLMFVDPDSNDYQYGNQILTMNLSCSHGRLFLNEEYLRADWESSHADDDPTDPEIEYVLWPGVQRRGVHYYDTEQRMDMPRFGLDFADAGQDQQGCQFKPQCSNGNTLRSSDSRFGFFNTSWYGVVYSPQINGDGSLSEIGCGHCPDEVGNHFLSLRGTLSSINKALESVTYLPDPDFNTRFGGQKEEIVFEVDDNGARGDDNSAPTLTNRRVINVIVESINDRPFVGVRKRAQRAIKAYDGQSSDRVVDDFRVEAINKTIEAECFALAPASPEYWARCNPELRRYIDIDEDTQFFIGPQVLWIADVDSAEATQMPALRRYCCAEAGEVACRCGRSCRCGDAICKCSVPEVCQGGAGQLLVSLQVREGLLTFSPPPGREVFPMDEVTFLTNVTGIDVKNGGFTMPCADQQACAVNMSRIMMLTNIDSLQQGLEQLFLSYRGRPDWYGRDELEVWVSDQGYTDECYNATLSTTETVSIRVVGINDPPTLTEPGSVLVYQRGQRCYVDWHEFDTSSVGMIPSCEFQPNSSLVPPPPSMPLAFRDVDLADNPTRVAEMSVIIAIGNDGARHASAGGLMFADTVQQSNMWLTEYVQEGLKVTMIQGSLNDINWLMQLLRYDADPTYQGYAPFVVNVNDNLNYGECSGNHVCGAFQAVCMDHTKAEAHVAPDPGTNRVVLDVVIGSAVRCSATDCDLCNVEAGCGWCPGACTEAGGKCMIGSAGGPQFESCEADEEGKGWMQCQLTTVDWVTTGAALGGSLFVFGVVFYLFHKWVLRRYGSILRFVKKKRVDTALVMTKLNILPPADANYNQFFLLALLGIIIVVIMPLLSTPNPQCTFGRNFFLDKVTSVAMKLDNCKVRFLPPRFSPPPENALEAPKIKLAFTQDKDIMLEADSCTQDATFELINDRPDSVKYLGYYCNIEILVPDRFVLPEFTIEAAGDNTTSVRVSATDSDSTEFGLDFGPNRFTLTGNRLVASLQNISSKFFTYDVVHGSLMALDLSTTVSGSFTSTDADMIVTTKFRTSVDFWQKSGNQVCLSAAPGSLYVDDACQEVCVLKGSNSSSSSSGRRAQRPGFESESSTTDDDKVRALGSNTTIKYGLVITDPVYGDNRSKWVCHGDPEIDEEWSCEPYDATDIALSQPCPVGSPYETKGDVPQIDGCTNLDFCLLEESSQCLCKPTCDMAGLDPPGTCNEGGQCCQVLCEGYSKADMLPKRDQPRCGARIDPSLTWCDNNLDQKFTFTSDRGQIAVQVLEECDPFSPSNCSESPVSSYRGSAPTSDRIETNVDILEDNKKVLDDLFHPGGANAPKVDWFTLGLNGPGTADASVGQFVFLRSVRHLVLAPWLMNVLSYGLLAPDRSASTSNLNPGFCPAFPDVNGSEFNLRLAEQYKVLLDTVQLYPPPAPLPAPQDEDEKIIPVNSLITFRQVSGPPRVFLTDVTTGKTTVSRVVPQDYPLLLLLLGLGVVIPFLAAIMGTGLFFLKGRTHLQDYRQSKLMQEHLMRNLGAVLAGRGPDPDEDDVDIPRERVQEMRGRTGFFYMYEEFVGNAEAQRTLFGEWGLVLSELVVALLPPIFPFLFAGSVEMAYKAQRCEYRYDGCRCMSETDGILVFPWVLRVLVYIYSFLTLLELGLHYLAVSYNLFRKVLRAAFYLLFLAMIFLTVVTTGTVFLFCILGVLVKASLTGPYALAVLGTLTVAAAMFVKRVKLMMRVSRGVTKRVTAAGQMIGGNMPKPLLDAMMSKYIQQSLHDHGLSVPKIVISIVFMLLGLTAIFFFLFQGFEAFTDPTDLNSALINMSIIVSVCVGAYQTMVSDGDPAEMSHKVEMLTNNIMSSLEKILKMIAHQIQTARFLYDEMQRLDMQAVSDEESEEDDQDEDQPLIKG